MNVELDFGIIFIVLLAQVYLLLYKLNSMNQLIKIIIGCSFLLLFSSCFKEVPMPTQLRIQVFDDQGYTQPNAFVTLYQSQSDYLAFKNPIAQTYTDQNGYFYFSGLSTNIYYYYSVEMGCLDNFYSSNHITSLLEPQVLNEYEPIRLGVIGTIKVENDSYNPYDVYLDGYIVYNNLTGNKTISINDVRGGNHLVKVVQLNGFNDHTYNVNVSCGVIPTVIIP